MTPPDRAAAWRPSRRLIILWIATAAILVAGVAVKAIAAASYRHRLATLTAHGELPSQISYRAAAAFPSLRNHQRLQVLSTLRLTVTQERYLPASPPDPARTILTCGDLARDGYEVTLAFGPDDRLRATGTTYDDDRRMGAANAVAVAARGTTDVVGPLAGVASVLCLVLLVLVQRRRRSFGGVALALAATCCVTLALSSRPDRTFVDGRREDVHWSAFAILAVAAAVTFWPARRRGRDGGCLSCGYDLTGNVSGVCPECGTAIRSATVPAAAATSDNQAGR